MTDNIAAYGKTAWRRSAFLASVGQAHPFEVLLVVAVLVIFCLGYIPTLVTDYVTEDEWRAFRYSFPANSATFRWDACFHMVVPFYIYTGRPLSWMGECIEHAWVAHIHDYLFLRPFALLLMLATVLALGQALTRVMRSFPLGVIVGAVMLYSPGYAFIYFQSVVGAPLLLSVLLAILSLSCINKGLGWYDVGGARRAATWIATGMALFTVALLMFPGFPFVALPLAVLQFGFETEHGCITRFWRLLFVVLVYVAATIAYVAITKLWMFGYYLLNGEWSGLAYLGPRHFAFRLSLPALEQNFGLLRFFFVKHLPALNFIGVPWQLKVAGFMLGVVAFVLQDRRSGGDTRQLVLRTVAFACIGMVVTLGSLSPWLVSELTAPSLHYTVPLQFLFVGLLAKFLQEVVVAIAGDGRIHDRVVAFVLLGLLLLPTTLQEDASAQEEVTLSKSEIGKLRESLRGAIRSGEFNRLQQIHLVRPFVWGLPYAQLPARLELIEPTTSTNPVAILWMLTAVLRELLPPQQLSSLQIADCQFDRTCVAQSARPGVIVLSQSLPGENPPLLERSLVLDYSSFEQDFGG